MAYKKKKHKIPSKKPALSYGMSDYFATCLVIITFIALLFNYIGLASNDYRAIVVFDLVFIAVAAGIVLLLTGRVRSESFKRSMILVSALCAVVLIYIVVSVGLFAI